MLIFDGHLDIAYNALSHERDPLLSVDQTRAREADPVPDDGRGICTSSLHEMREAGVAVALTTVLARCKPWVKPGRSKVRLSGDWTTPEMCYAVSQAMLAYYRMLETQGHVTIIETAKQLQTHWSAWQASSVETRPPVGLILTMECADSIVEPAQLDEWHAQGLRTLLLTHFGMGRYGAGNPSTSPDNRHDVDGPVTPLGIELLDRMHGLGMPLDLTHCSDTTFWGALEHFGGRVYSSHANCRAISDEQRQLSDEMIRAIIERGGVLGVALAINMIRVDLIDGPPWTPLQHEVRLEHLADHIDHICQLAGNARHVAWGTDTDGGFGTEACPHGYDRHRDLHKVAEIMRDRGYSDGDITDVFGGNWLRFHGETLPAE